MAKQFDDEELKKKLTPEQYHILREKGTEAPGTGKYLNHSEKGMYTCAVCGAPLFKSDSKYDSKTPGLINPSNLLKATSVMSTAFCITSTSSAVLMALNSFKILALRL